MFIRWQSAKAYRRPCAGVLASLSSTISIRVDRFLFHLLSSGSIILALLMASAFLESSGTPDLGASQTAKSIPDGNARKEVAWKL
jgi:hypothetical protein